MGSDATVRRVRCNQTMGIDKEKYFYLNERGDVVELNGIEPSTS